MSDVIDGLIENVNDVTEECTNNEPNNAHTIQNVISVDRFNDNDDGEKLRYLL